MFATKFNTYLENGVLKPHTIPMSNQQYSEISKAIDNIRTANRMEELYSCFVDSYIEVKKCIYDNVITDSCRPVSYHELDYSIESKLKLNRLLFNFLNLGKAYEEKCYKEKVRGKKSNRTIEIKSYIIDMVHDEAILHGLKSLKKSIYEDQAEGYAIGYSLRNYSSHDDPIMIRSISRGFNWEVGASMNKTFTVTFDTSLLGDKKPAHIECKMVDLHQVIDDFACGISKLHFYCRDNIKKQMELGKSLIKSRIDHIETEFKNICFGIEVWDITNNINLYPLFLDNFDTYDYFLKKNAVGLSGQRINLHTYTTSDR